MDLHLHVKTIYFDQIKAGTKDRENRLENAYWIKRIRDRQYRNVIIYNAYKPGAENRLTFPYVGFESKTIHHEHFGPLPVGVFAIILKKKGEL